VSSSITLAHDQKLHNAELDRFLAKLLFVEGAAFNDCRSQHESTCHEGTREDILRDVTNWADGDSTETIFWLSGMAGTGKSTIARTIAQSLRNNSQLAASFFFSRGQGDLGHAGKFFSTLAYQMAIAFPKIGEHISKAIRDQPDITHKAMFEQYDKLIIGPIRESRANSLQYPRCIIVVDALDECSYQQDIELILRLFASTSDMNQLKLRIFLTSRPDNPIPLGFREMSSIVHRDLTLHHVPRSIVEEDILKFMKHKFDRIRVKRNQDCDWPGEQTIIDLVKHADGLFIFAATACRYVDGPQGTSPAKRLCQLLERSVGSSVAPVQRRLGCLTQTLDEMYTTILQNSIIGDYDEEEKAEAAERFRQVVGSIVVLDDVLTVKDLGVFLMGSDEANSTRIVRETLDSLHSVLDAEDPNVPVRLLHPSFRDFLFDAQRCIDRHFWIDKRLVHHDLAGCCLRDMSKHLRKNICQLSTPGPLSTDHRHHITRYIPPHLQYACQHWVSHVREGKFSIQDDGEVHRFLQEHFLHWLEALSILGRTAESLAMIMALEALPTVSMRTRRMRG